nr:hypothetical protein [Tanacetum cinerariifolium]
MPAMPIPPTRQVLSLDVLATHAAWVKASKEIVGLMLMTMKPDIQKNLEQLGRRSVYELLRSQMESYIDNLERLGHFMSQNLELRLILVPLRKEYDSFVQNYTMHDMGKTMTELHAMLKLHEQTLPKKDDAPALHAIGAGKVSKKITKIRNRNWLLGETIKGNEKVSLLLLLRPRFSRHQRTIMRRTRSVTNVNNTILVSRNNVVYFSVVPRDVIFKIDLSNSNTNDSSMYVISNKRAKIKLDSTLLWYYRLRHISKKHIEKLQHDGLLNSTDNQLFDKCISCMSRKMPRKPYSHQVERAKDLLGLIHTDVCGSFRTVSRQGASYFVTFADDFGRYGYVYLQKHKHEVFKTFKVFQKEVENQLKKTTKSPCSNHRGEYMSQEFFAHLKEHVIIAHRTLPYTPQHNGVSERRNRTLLDMVKKTPYEIWHGKAPKMSYLKVWGCEEVVKYDTLTKPDKLESRSIKCIFIGYPKETIGYSLYYLPENKEYELGDLNEPANYKAALLDPESDKWLDVMNVEIQSMKDNQVWDLVDLPPNDKAIGSKWLFKKKTDMDGAVHTYKACVVAKGFTQTYRVDYKETFCPVADIRAIRILIAIAAFYDYEIWQMDVKIAFLDRHLSEEVYMVHPEDLGKAAYILGIKIYRDRSRRLIGLSQSAYIEKILKRFFMEISKRVSIPMQEKLKLCKSQGASTPVEKPGKLHWTVVKNILKYLCNTKDMFLVYEGDIKRELKVSCYTDVGYLTDVDDLKSQTGYVFVLNGGAVMKFISVLGIIPTIEEPIKMYFANTRSINIANESGVTKGARHYRAKVHYLREVIEFGDMKLEKVHTDDNLADPFTKALPYPKHSEHTKNIGMFPASCLM